MKTGITPKMQEYFADMTESLEIVSGDYVRSEFSEITKANIKHLFPNDKDAAKLINPGTYYASVVYDWISSYFGSPQENYGLDYITLIEWLLCTGKIILRQDIVNKKLVAQKCNHYYYDEVEKKEFFISLYSDIEWLKNITYLLVESFKDWILERNLFKLWNVQNYTEGEKIPLESLQFLWYTEARDARVTIGLDYKRLVFEVEVERPIIKKIKTLIFSIEKKLSEAEKNFLDYTEQFKIFKNISIPENAYTELPNGVRVINFDKLGKILTTSSLDWAVWGIEIVKNTNELLVEALNHIESQIRNLSAITSIPIFAFWITSNEGNDSGTAKTKSMGLFYKKIQKYRDEFKWIVSQFWELHKISELERILEFPDLVTTDSSEILDTEEKKLKLWLTTKLRAIMRIEWVTKEEAEMILEEIKNENLLLNTQNGTTPTETQV